MKTLPANLETAYAAEAVALAWCARVVRQDAVVLGMTGLDRDIVIASGDLAGTYTAQSGLTASAVQSQTGIIPDNQEVSGLQDDGYWTDAEFLAGAFDYAKVTIFICDVAAPDDGQDVKLTARLGQIQLIDGSWNVELSSLSKLLDQNIMQLYSSTCRAEFCNSDTGCTLSAATYTDTGTISTVTSQADITINFGGTTYEDNDYAYGKITWTSGNNTGLSCEVARSTANRLYLLLPMPYMIEVGDAVSVRMGCDKTWATCQAFGSSPELRFRGEPHKPDEEILIRTPNAR